MKSVSKFALTLSLLALPLAASHAAVEEKPAKEKKGKDKKEAAPAAPKRNYSKPFIAAYTPVVDLLNKIALRCFERYLRRRFAGL